MTKEELDNLLEYTKCKNILISKFGKHMDKVSNMLIFLIYHFYSDVNIKGCYQIELNKAIQKRIDDINAHAEGYLPGMKLPTESEYLQQQQILRNKITEEATKVFNILFSIK